MQQDCDHSVCNTAINNLERLMLAFDTYDTIEKVLEENRSAHQELYDLYHKLTDRCRYWSVYQEILIKISSDSRNDNNILQRLQYELQRFVRELNGKYFESYSEYIIQEITKIIEDEIHKTTLYIENEKMRLCKEALFMFYTCSKLYNTDHKFIVLLSNVLSTCEYAYEDIRKIVKTLKHYVQYYRPR